MNHVIDFETLKEKMEIIINTFVSKCSAYNPTDKTGGCLVIADRNGVEISHGPVGTNIDDYEKYHRTALRKIQQMVDNPDDPSSYPSRNPNTSNWGGGISLFDNGFVAFSGLPELADEACLLSALFSCKYIKDVFDILTIVELSDNPIYRKLHR